MAKKKKATGSMVSFAKKRKARKSLLEMEKAFKKLEAHIRRHHAHLKAMVVFQA